MKAYFKAIMIGLLALASVGAATMSFFFSTWILDSTRAEEADMRRHLVARAAQAVMRAQDELYSLLPLLSQSNDMEDVKSAYSAWAEDVEHPGVVAEITFADRSHGEQALSYRPTEGVVSASTEPGIWQYLRASRAGNRDALQIAISSLYRKGYIIVRDFLSKEGQGGADKMIGVRTNDEKLVADLLAESLKATMPEYGYSLSYGGAVVAQNEAYAAQAAKADLEFELSGNLVMYAPFKAEDWGGRPFRQASLLVEPFGAERQPAPDRKGLAGAAGEPPPFASDGDVPREAPPQSPQQESLIRVSIKNEGGSIEGIIAARRALYLGAGNLSIALVWGTVVLFFFLYGRARELRLQEREFVSSVSHELRTPIAVILAASDNLSMGMVEGRDRVAHYGAEIRKQSQRLSRMVEGILMYSRIGNDSVLRPKPREIDPAEALRDALKPLGEIARGMGAELRESIEGLPAKVEADPAMLAIIVENLVMNALHHGRPPLESGREHLVEFLARREGEGALAIVVRDNGCGIDPKERKKLFAAFYRGKRSVREQHPGSGIGLHLLEIICKAQGGSITIGPRSDGLPGAEARATIKAAAL
jgi:signal transduction histidine kinase